MIGNCSDFIGSKISQDIYDMMEDYMEGMDTFDVSLIKAISDYFTNYTPEIKWSLGCADWPDMSGGVCFYAWIENGELHQEGFEYVF